MRSGYGALLETLVVFCSNKEFVLGISLTEVECIGIHEYKVESYLTECILIGRWLIKVIYSC